jgi:hypothetical protein
MKQASDAANSSQATLANSPKLSFAAVSYAAAASARVVKYPRCCCLPPTVSNVIVQWNFSQFLALANMKKLEPAPEDLMLGSVVLALLLAVIINGIVWSIV